MINKLMIKGKLFDKILLGMFVFCILYFLIGLFLRLNYLTIFTNGFFLCFFIIVCRFIYKVIKFKMPLIIKICTCILVSLALLLITFFSIFRMSEDSFRYNNEKIIVINNYSTLFDSEIELYKIKFLIYKKPLNRPIEIFNYPLNTDNYELPNDINDYL